jgi:hypothetical protein
MQREIVLLPIVEALDVKEVMTATVDELRYPIGKFAPSASPDADVRRGAIADIAALPARMREAVAGLSDAQLDTPYRPGGWTVRQVVHHVADSHLNAFLRLKLALTETAPAITAYNEKAFAELGDVRLPVAVSLELLASLHARWIAVYSRLDDAQFMRTFIHPEYPEPQTLDRQAQLYSWHSRHHVAHITALRQRAGW